MGEFYTLKGYSLHDDNRLSTAGEDYLEMICRLYTNQSIVRLTDISKELHVRPSSASKMIQRLCAHGYLRAEKYAEIHLTERGRRVGEYLMRRHDVLLRFLCWLNGSDDELEQAEKIEHFISPRTLENIERLLYQAQPPKKK